jgi:hypothetical protein
MAKSKIAMNTQNQNHDAAALDNSKRDTGTVEVLYQKMGDRWFAFSLIDDEVFVGSISQDEIDVPQKEL